MKLSQTLAATAVLALLGISFSAEAYDADWKRGVYKGRRRVLTNAKAAELQRRATEGDSKTALARELGISRETVYQYLRNATEHDQNTAT